MSVLPAEDRYASVAYRRQTRAAAQILAAMGTPLLIRQPSYSLLSRWIEPELLDVLEETGVG